MKKSKNLPVWPSSERSSRIVLCSLGVLASDCPLSGSFSVVACGPSLVSFYRRVLWPILSRLDPEKAHALAFRWMGSPFGRLLPPANRPDPILCQTLWGREFASPLGLAAGLDKDGVLIDAWERMGFGFCEAGTVTPEAQPGNPPPRLHRLLRDRALINRMGFNNDGAAALGKRLTHVKAAFPIGVNIGKGRNTPLEDAAEDYRRGSALVDGSPAYIAINVSSPNTPGLRDLQSEEHLRGIIRAVREARPGVPVFVKVSPDLTEKDLDEVLAVADSEEVEGLIATNTTLSRVGLSEPSDAEGGLSGAPLRARATEVVRYIHTRLPAMVIIGVGGVFTGADAFEKISAGASLVQVYTAFVYEGPALPSRIARDLAAIVRDRGFGSLSDAVGSGG